MSTSNINELRANIPEGLTEAQAFFYANAGFCVEAGESTQEAMIRCAKELAKAEAWAQEMGVKYLWEDDDQPAEVYNEKTGEYDELPAVVCIAKLHGEVIASLCGITESDSAKEAQNYRRIVEAELASSGRDHLPGIAQEYKNKGTHFLGDYERYNDF